MSLTTVQPGMLGTPQPYNFKNRLINGAMVFDQRNAGASVSLITAGGNGYATDRWYAENTTSGTATIQQVSDAPSGFAFSTKWTVTGVASSIISTDSAFIQQRIEGFNSYDLMFGTASASNIAISFWVKSSVTGTFGGALANSAYNRGYSFTYTINSANTWEYKVVTLTGDTTGTWVTNNGIGIRLTFAVAAGSARGSTPGSWGAFTGIGANGQINLMATNAATFQITGIQFEVGVSATTFDYRSYGIELQLCQRYFQPITNYVGTSQTSSSFLASYRLAVPMRTAPTVSLVNNTFGITSNAVDYQTTSAAIDYSDNLINPSYAGGRFRITGFSGLPVTQFGFTGLAAGSAPNFGINASAEL